MKPATITVLGRGDTRWDAECWPTPVPGLVINRDPVARDLFNVTHKRSGAALAHVPDPELALHVAIKLGAITDWTRPGIALRRDREVTRAVGRILRETGAEQYADGKYPVTRARLVAVEMGAR